MADPLTFSLSPKLYVEVGGFVGADVLASTAHAGLVASAGVLLTSDPSLTRVGLGVTALSTSSSYEHTAAIPDTYGGGEYSRSVYSADSSVNALAVTVSLRAPLWRSQHGGVGVSFAASAGPAFVTNTGVNAASITIRDNGPAGLSAPFSTRAPGLLAAAGVAVDINDSFSLSVGGLGLATLGAGGDNHPGGYVSADGGWRFYHVSDVGAHPLIAGGYIAMGLSF